MERAKREGSGVGVDLWGSGRISRKIVPFGAPSFGYHFKVGLDFQHYKASLDGEHSGFPSFTVKVGGVPIYQWEQTNIFGLFAPMVHAHVTSADW